MPHKNHERPLSPDNCHEWREPSMNEDFEILFVDDDRHILSLVKEYLTLQGYTITVVDNGLDAFELLKEKGFCPKAMWTRTETSIFLLQPREDHLFRCPSLRT